VKGLVPSSRERPFISVAEALSRLREEGVCFAYIAAVRTVFFPKPISPAPIRRRDEISTRRS
jgi:hypothetical protein